MAKELINRSDEFRKLIFQQSDRYNLPFTHICNHIHLDYERFIKGYANIKNLSESDAVMVTDNQLIEIGKMLGVNVRMVLVIRDEKAFSQEIVSIKEKLKDEYISRKKKGTVKTA